MCELEFGGVLTCESGSIAEQMGDVDRSLNAYEHAIRHNPDSVPAHLRVASIARSRDEFVRVRAV